MAFALYVSLTCSAAAPGFAQGRDRQPRNAPPNLTRAGGARGGAAAVPTRRASLVGEGGRRIPYDVPVRVLDPEYARTGKRTARNGKGTTRAQIGGPNGANVIEQVVSATFVSNTTNPDDRTPFWSVDERFLYFSSNRDNARYNLYQVLANPSQNPAAPATPVVLTPNTGRFDYLFPAVDKSGTRIAFLRSSDANAIDAAAKRFDLFVSALPSSGTVDEAPGGASNLIPLTVNSDGSPRAVVTGPGTTANIVNVRRAAWIGSTDLVVSAQLQGRSDYDLFIINTSTRQIIQLTDSPADEQNPAVSPDGRTIAFDSDTTVQRSGVAESYTPGTPRSVGNPSAVPATAPRNAGGPRAIFTISSDGRGQPTQFSGRLGAGVLDARVSDVQPAWSSDTQNVFTGTATQPNLLLLAWSSNRKAVYDPTDPTRTVITRFDLNPNGTFDTFFAYQTLDSSDPSRAQDQIEEAPGANFPARPLNTDDPGSVFNDLYPSWAPLITLQRIAVQSNRTGIYTKDAYPQGGGWTAGANDVLIASVIDITAPTLLRFDTQSSLGEVVHINIGDTYNPGGTVRTREDGVLPGGTLFFTVRVEDREAGMRQPDAPGQTPKAVFLQFKNPNSKYQSTAQGGRGVEHKEFISDKLPRGADLGFTFVENNATTALANLTTGRFFGPEFECQAISAADRTTYFGHSCNPSGLPFGELNINDSDPTSLPLYTASIDDASAFAGGFNTPLDGTNGKPDVWLELLPLTDAAGQPIRPADGQGGVLYGAKWQIPDEASDWYIDVILYDNAVNPFNQGFRSNFIIYDNVWGFSSALPIAPAASDILVINDYMLGQKFFGSRFGGAPTSQPNALNLQPLFYGAEAYYTDIDVSLFPSYPVGGVVPQSPAPSGVRFWDQDGPFNATGIGPGLLRAPGGYGQGIPNTLGVNSYMDQYLLDGAQVIDGKYLAPTQRYSIYRVLSRGPVPPQLLNAYLPQRTQTPHDSRVASDPLAAEPNNVASPRNVLNANRCVVWGSPFSGDLFVGPGTITDINTQNALTDFVSRGGRLFISGQDIGFALAGNGQNPAFFTQTLGATFTADNSRSQTLVPAGVTAAPYNGQIVQDAWDTAQNTSQAFGRYPGTPPWPYVTLNSDNYALTNFEINPAATVFGDGAYTATAGLGFGFDAGNGNFFQSGLNDVIGAGPDARLEMSYAGGGGAMLSKYSAVSGIPTLPTFLTFGKGAVVYAAFGFESLSNGWYTYSDPTGTAFLATVGKRAGLMHNVVETFRTGTLIGQLIDDSGSAVTDALVRAVPTVGDEASPAVGTAITDRSGNFQIVGLPPGAYVVYGYKAGFYSQHTNGNSVHGGWRSSLRLALKRANPGRLTGIPNTDTQNPQGGVYKSDGVTPIDGVVEVQARRVNPDGTETVIRTLTSDGDDTNNAQQATQFPGVTISSGPRGAYQFPTLLIDRYRIIANPSTLGNAADGTPIPNPAQGQGGTFRTDLTPDIRVGNAAQAALYRLGAGTTIDNSLAGDPRVVINENQTAQIDFLLAGAPQSVIGRVTDAATGAGIPNATVTAVLGTDNTKSYSGTTDQNGNYVIQVPAAVNPNNLLPEGSYNITATAPGYQPATQNNVNVGGNAAVPVTVNFALTALPPGSVSGLVSGENGNFQVPLGAVVRLYPVSGTTPSNTPLKDSAGNEITATVGAVQNNNGYQFNYKFDSVPSGSYVATVTKAGFRSEPAVSAVFTVNPSTETRNINFLLRAPAVYGRGLQLISTPLDYAPTGVTARAVFGLKPDLGALYTQFNVFAWNPVANDYVANPDLAFQLGNGYFVNFADTASVATVNGAAFTGSSFSKPLAPGWNLIGHPFTDPNNPSTPAADLDLFKDAQIVTPTDPAPLTWQQAIDRGYVRGVAFGYTGSQTGSQYYQTSTLRAWNGYWLRNTARDAANNPIAITLVLNRPATRSIKQLMAAAKDEGKTRLRSIGEKNAPNNWRLQIAARQGDLVDTDNAIGVAPGAQDGFDTKFDTEKPPMMGPEIRQVYVSLDGKNENGRAAAFADDVRSGDQNGPKSWDFTVRATGEGSVTVFWPNVSRLPKNVEPVLVDTVTGQRTPMRNGGTSSYTFTPDNKTGGGREVTRHFRVEVTRAASLPLAISNVKQTKVGTRASGAPAAVRFSFTVTRAADVTAEIQTLSGSTIQRFQTRAVQGAETGVTWDGRAQDGAAVPSGAYMLTLSARDGEGHVTRVRLPLIRLR